MKKATDKHKKGHGALTCHAMAPGDSMWFAAAVLPAGAGALDVEPPIIE
jgi:hypothetical protein